MRGSASRPLPLDFSRQTVSSCCSIQSRNGLSCFVNTISDPIYRHERFHLALGVAPFHDIIPSYSLHRMIIRLTSTGVANIVAIRNSPVPYTLPLRPGDLIFADLENGNSSSHKHRSLWQDTRWHGHHLSILLESLPDGIGFIHRKTDLCFIGCACTRNTHRKPIVSRDGWRAAECSRGGIECHAWRKIAGTNGPCFRAVATARREGVACISLVQNGLCSHSAGRNQWLHGQCLCRIGGGRKVGISRLAGSDGCNANSSNCNDPVARYRRYAGIGTNIAHRQSRGGRCIQSKCRITKSLGINSREGNGLRGQLDRKIGTDKSDRIVAARRKRAFCNGVGSSVLTHITTQATREATTAGKRIGICGIVKYRICLAFDLTGCCGCHCHRGRGNISCEIGRLRYSVAQGIRSTDDTFWRHRFAVAHTAIGKCSRAGKGNHIAAHHSA